MECPHLSHSVKINNDPRQEKTDVTKEWQCAVCSARESPWMCLHCGVVNCGRYIKGHAKEHSEEHENHTVCMDCENYSVFCYTCDEFVLNDTDNGLIEQLRQCLCDKYESTGSEDNMSSTSNEIQSSWKALTLASKEIQENARKLRPRSRKRLLTSENNGTCRHKIQHVEEQKSIKGNKLRGKRVVGLRNLGNTCFMNAVLQSLSNIQEFCYYFKQLPSFDSQKSDGKRVYQSRSFKDTSDTLMTEELRKVIISLTQGGTKGAISPESLFLVIWKVVPRFRGYQQQDAHEFLRYMLDRLHTELLHLLPDFTLHDSPYISLAQKGKSSIVTSVFGGTLQSEVRCLNCCTESKKHDPFLDLSLDIPDKFQFNHKKSKEGEETSPPCSISDCLTSFIEVEELAETELYYCSSCKSKQRSTKRFWIRRLPNVLCLHLKRFRWHNFFRTKIDTHVSFPVTALDMSHFVLNSLRDTRRSGTGSNLYDLAAVIVHHGSGAGSGHYTAFAINDGQWFHFNDSTVRPTEADVVAKCKPYILFYIRREFRLPHFSS